MLQYQPHDDDTVSDAEMEEIVRRLHTIETKTSTADVAEALGVSQELVRQMLSDIRAGTTRTVVPPKEKTRNPRRRRLVAWSLSGCAALIMLGAGIEWVNNQQPHGALPAPNGPQPVIAEKLAPEPTASDPDARPRSLNNSIAPPAPTR